MLVCLESPDLDFKFWWAASPEDLLVSIETAGSSFPTVGGGGLVDFVTLENLLVLIEATGSHGSRL